MVMTMNVPPTHSAANNSAARLVANTGVATPSASTNCAQAQSRRDESAGNRRMANTVEMAAAAPNTGQTQPNTAGDLITGGLSWTRPVRLGGIQWRRNFGVRPDLITYPIPSFASQATVPSTVELLVNNIQQFGTQVNDGPFVLDTFPRISGAGEATLVVRDALGLDFVPGGVDAGTDDIIYDITGGVSTSGFGHPTCGGTEDTFDMPTLLPIS